MNDGTWLALGVVAAAAVGGVAVRSRGSRGMSLLDRIIDSAEQHGLDSEPDHEVGDLQDALRHATLLMDDHQIEALTRWARDYYDASAAPDDIAEFIIERAYDHGIDSEPDHEVGDLQDALRAALPLLDADQERELSAFVYDFLV